MVDSNWYEEIDILFDKNVNVVSEITNKEKFLNCCRLGKGIYCGFDPTLSRLHLGNLIQLNLLKRFKSWNCKPIVIIGGATGLIGDPSGKKVERKILDKKIIDFNKEAIKKQVLNFFSNDVVVIDNLNFYQNVNFLNFLRSVGKDFNVNNLLRKEVIKKRLETGISFTEFSYQLLQAYDFFCLYQNYECYGQIGGSDQWGNITSGVDYCSKKITNCNAFGITFKLLTDSNNNKFGKTESGAIFLDEPWKIYNYLLSISDQMINQICYLLMNLPVKEIKKILEKHHLDCSKKIAQIALTKNVISYLFSLEDYNNYQKINNILFYNKEIDFYLFDKYFSFIPSTYLNIDNVYQKAIDFLNNIDFFSSKTKIKQYILQKCLFINKKIVTKELQIKDFICLNNKINEYYYFLIQIGKKKFFLIRANINI